MFGMPTEVSYRAFFYSAFIARKSFPLVKHDKLVTLGIIQLNISQSMWKVSHLKINFMSFANSSSRIPLVKLRVIEMFIL